MRFVPPIITVTRSRNGQRLSISVVYHDRVVVLEGPITAKLIYQQRQVDGLTSYDLAGDGLQIVSEQVFQ